MKVRGNMEFEGRRRWLGLLAATLALPGCVSMGPRPEQAALPADWDNRGEVAARTETPPRWWTAFEDAELDALAERALAGNLTLAQAAQRLKAARALSRSSAAQALPQIGLHGAAQRQHRLSGPHGANELSGAEAGQGELPLAQEERSIGYYQAGFDARWELDLFGRIAAATDAARASAGAAEADLRAARVSVAAEAVRAYIELRGAQRRHQVLSGLLDDQRHLLALVQERRRAGIASDFDVDRASVLEAETAAQLPLSAQLARQHAQRLAVLTGESQIAPGLLASAGQPLPRGEPTAPLPADIVRVRPDIRRAEQQVLQAAAELRVSIAELYPRLTLSGDIQITGNLTGKPLPGRSTMRRAGCPDPAAAGLGLATGRGRRARGRTGRGHPGLSAGRAGGRRGNRKRPGRLGGARTARAADRRAFAGVAAGGRARGAVVRARHDQSAGTPERVGRASPGGVGRGRGVGGTGVGVRGGEQGDGGGGV